MKSSTLKPLILNTFLIQLISTRNRIGARVLLLVMILLRFPCDAQKKAIITNEGRERISLNHGWRFMRYQDKGDELIYDERPVVFDRKDDVVADSKPSQKPLLAGTSEKVLKKWILPTANDFIKDESKHYVRPAGDPGSNFPFVQLGFNDKSWEKVDLPHDWAVKGPFYKEANAIVGGGMGRLPIQGIAWYRRKIGIPIADRGKNIYLEIEGAMSYAMVWLNGHLVGGWPYGYNSFRLDLTPYIKFGLDNQIAIRLDNPPNSSRWYPGSGLYRNVWLTKTNAVQIAQWGTCITTSDISKSSAVVNLDVNIENKADYDEQVKVLTDIYSLDNQYQKVKKISSFPLSIVNVNHHNKYLVKSELLLNNPALWQPLPTQKPNLYAAVTRLYTNNRLVDTYETRFGIRDIRFDPVKGVIVNGKAVKIQGVNQHHDLGALGAAFNYRAAERQLELLREMGCNAIRLSHNPPAPELLDITDKMGFLVINEIFDCWEQGKTPLDFHLIFPDWSEADTRSFIRRDKNHPSIIAWSFGNEVGEQYTATEGATIARRLSAIVKDEDPTRPATASMNYAKPDMPFPAVMDILSLNYQGEGIRDAPAYAKLKGIRTAPLYPAFHDKFPGKLIISSETASTLSTRGTYIFPVTSDFSAPVSDTTGGDAQNQYVSAYELYTAQFGASPDKVFASQDKHPFVCGEFVWSGWDYLGEPTPYYGARSSYSGIIDLAGFKKDRFYLYQARWRPDLRFAHILPHWNWLGREGKITPVHIFSSADEAELFLNGRSLGRKKRVEYQYRFRWDDVKYEPGELKVLTYKHRLLWATETLKTAGQPVRLGLRADRRKIKDDGADLAFITVKVLDKDGNIVPIANNKIVFSISGPAEIVATDNGDPADLVAFPSKERKALSGMALVIVRSLKKAAGKFELKAEAENLGSAKIVLSTSANLLDVRHQKITKGIKR
ncbi:beta-galactosidase [Mucilaginibacter gracilis]|uniref:Glycoside hydrolase family 2 sugar binding n=2 Tax=Mucilaginibacter TaxID=423349 RepID=H1YHR0_9SPHI|nr:MULTISPECIES: beta-galactosidase GalB [Mucilaginibacter]EHQ27460.1 glycoside hydrolase family 2 sugar binding [Mucilaginibacter paludis DSM 18603]RKR81027.1 beta-galactosidase [Mucilaginibacter gracilis]